MTTTVRSDASGTYGALQVNGADVVKFDATGIILGAGRRLAQIVTYSTGAVATGTTPLPFDNTIPQSTEGDQYLSLAITPQNSASILEITIVAMLASSVVNNMTLALFQDSAVSSLAASTMLLGIADGIVAISLNHILTIGTTSTTTFKVRGGGSFAGTTTLNGVAGIVRFGGILSSRIIIKEYLP